MDAEIDLEDVVVLQDDFFGAGVGGPVSCTIVQSQASRETLAGLEGVSSLDAWVTD